MKMRLQRAALAAMLLAAGSQGFAQFGGGMGGMGGRSRGRSPDTAASGRGADPAGNPLTAAAQMREKLYALRLRLMLTAEQAPLWEKFSSAVWDMGSRGDWSSSPTATEPTAVQALQQRAAQAQERTARLQALSDAASQLYAVLTPDQRHMADQDLPGLLPAERGATPPGAGTP